MNPERWRRIDDLFEAALQKPASERMQFLDEAVTEPDIYGEVASLIAAFEEAKSFLSMPSLPSEGATQPFSFLGAYRVDRELGSGGMGTVYLASRADRQFEKQVAIKVVRAGLEHEFVLGRFRSERQILATLDHPNIARLLDGGVTVDGRPYLVMEFVEGTRLDEYCAARDLSIDERLEVFSRICSAVQYAHERLVIHRDLKPGNILVSGAGHVKLLDFGIAKLLDASDGEERQETQPAVRMLTPLYASPEQAAGGRITTTSDIYTLGVILYELVSGVHPFRQGTQGDGPPRNKRLKGDLEKIVRMALRKEPERRYRSAGQLADDVRRYREKLPVAARKETAVYLAAKFVDRHRAATAMAAGIIGVLAGGLAFTAYEARVAQQQRTKAEYVKSFVQTTLSGADPTWSSPFKQGRELRVAEVLDVAVRRVDSELRREPLLAAELRRELALSYLGLGLYPEAERLARAAAVQENALLGGSDPATRKSREVLDRVLAHEGAGR